MTLAGPRYEKYSPDELAGSRKAREEKLCHLYQREERQRVVRQRAEVTAPMSPLICLPARSVIAPSHPTRCAPPAEAIAEER